MGDCEEPDIMPFIIEEFLKEASCALTKTGKAIADNQEQLLCLAAHDLKGMAANLGAARLAFFASELEQRGKFGAFLEAQSLQAQAERELENVRIALQEFLQKQITPF